MTDLQADSPLPGEEENSGVSSIWTSTLQELKDLQDEVRVQRGLVQELLTEGNLVADSEPALQLGLESDLVNLQYNWKLYNYKLRALRHRRSRSEEVDLFVVKSKFPVSPLFHRLPSPCEKRVLLKFNGSRSLLASEGRIKVPKLSPAYRAAIKSKVKHHSLRTGRISEKSNSPHSSIISNGSSSASDGTEASSFSQECNLQKLKGAFPRSFENLSSSMEAREETYHKDGSPALHPGKLHLPLDGIEREVATLLADAALPSEPKRRRMNGNHTSGDSRMSTPEDSPVRMLTFYDSDMDSSNVSSATEMESPMQEHKSLAKDIKGRYKKDELWAAIQSDYAYLMDEEIIETCRSTESDLSWESDDLCINTKVSFTEFMQQYNELSEWLRTIRMVTQRQGMSLSEKYLNQTYHEEMLQRSPRRKLFNDYAKQLQRRYPNMKEEIQVRLQYLNKEWEVLEKSISPKSGYQDEETMLKDLEQDLNCLRKWLNDVENRLLPLCVRANWTTSELEDKLREHQELQVDIESHSKIVSAVLKLCERLQSDNRACANEGEKDSLQLVAINLERRWHAIWLQSLEWQCRLEEAIGRRKGLIPTGNCRSQSFDDLRFTTSKHSLGFTDHDIGEEEDKSDLTDVCDDGVDSDEHSSDVIPFEAHEYEKIAVDSDAQTEWHEDFKKTCDTGCGPDFQPVTDDKMEKDFAPDYELGKKEATRYSGSKYHSDIRLNQRHAQSDLQNKVSKEVLDIVEGKPKSIAMKSDRKLLKTESHDIGYSSESHSNDEPDFNVRLASTKEVMTSTPLKPQGHSEVKESVVVVVDAVVRRIKTPLPEVDDSANLTNVSPLPLHEKSWRHSMTSAYDTSSNCSEHNLDLETSFDAKTDDASSTHTVHQVLEKARQSPAKSRASPNRKYYSLGTDPEMVAEKATRLVVTSDNEIKLVESPSESGENSRPLSRLDRIMQDLEYRLEDDRSSHVSSLDHSSHDFSIEWERSWDGQIDPLDNNYSDNCGAERLSNNHSQSSSVSVQVGSDISHREAQLTQEDFLNAADAQRINALSQGSSESIKRLIKQAELLVMDEQLLLMHRAQQALGRKSKSQRRSKRVKYQCPPDSLTSTDASMPTDDSHISSCEASGEYTSGSDSSDEFSTATSDEDNLQNSVILANRSKSEDCQLDSRTVATELLYRGKSPGKKDRPHSVTELYELTNRLDLSPFSISESAIDNIQSAKTIHTGSSSSEHLRKTSTETVSPTTRNGTPPRSRVRTKSKRSKKSSEDGTNTSSKTGSDPNANSPAHRSGSSAHSSPLHKPHHTTSLTLLRQGSTEKTTTPSHSSTEKSHSGDLTIVSSSTEMCRKRRKTSNASAGSAGSCPSAMSEEEYSGHIQARDDVSIHSDGTDELLNSTASFSEHAWDNYQDPPYPSVSEDPTEEKLDDSHLQWDHTSLEFEDDFDLNSNRPGRKSPDKSRNRDRKSATKVVPSGYLADNSRMEDSDSDLEDLHHVIEESSAQLGFAESALKKHRKDVMDTGIYLDSSKYAELLATCQTNIKCLQVIEDTLSSDQGMANVSDHDFKKVEDIIGKWEVLETLASERQQQSRELAAIYSELLKLDKALAELEDELEVDCFEDQQDVEDTIRYIQKSRHELQGQREEANRLVASVTGFEQKNPHIQMDQFREETSDLRATVDELLEKSVTRTSELQSLLFSWYDYNETQKELSYLLKQERHQLRCLELSQDLVHFSQQQDIKDSTYDLKGMEKDLVEYEGKLSSLQRLSGEILAVCDENKEMEIRAEVAMAENELATISNKCQNLKRKMEERLEKLVAAEKKSVAMETQTCGKGADNYCMSDAQSQTEKAVKRTPLWLRFLKATFPLQVLLIIAIGLACLLDPKMAERCSLTFSPQLRYVRGPPPI